MLNQDEFTKEVSPTSRKFIGLGCLVIGIALGFAAWVSGEPTIIILAFIGGLPIGLVGLSILFGKAKRGHGVFSPFTLSVIGTLIIAGSLVAAYSGEPRSGVGIIFGLGCLALARKRKRRRIKW